ncbi:MAG: stimulus-sensing domain-containing protein, partial [Rubrimonas sp.]
ERANLLLRRLAQPAGVRARIFDRGGRLTGDTRSFSAGAAPVETEDLPPAGAAPETLLGVLEGWYGEAAALLEGPRELYRETEIAGVSTEIAVYEALRGRATRSVRVNSEGELIVSVALPVQRFKAVLGALVVSTEGGDIDAIVRAERIAILRVGLVALAVTAALSLWLAGAIALPLRRLSDAAETADGAGPRALDTGRVRFPDYTDRRDEIGRLSGALRRMTDALYDRIDAIERFAADVAHEIKNPLTSLRSAVESLRRTSDAGAQARLMAVIAHDVRRLDRLVTDISNASRLDAELARETMEPVDLGPLLRTVAEIAQARADLRGVRVEVEAPAAGLTVKGLESRLGQVFVNLADNAVSFSPPGGLVRLRAARGGSGWARVCVEDQGPGVPPDRREAIFERFWTERPDGEGFGDHSGLGLSISRQIVAAHGGRIRVEDAGNAGEAGGGARFTVELPQ